MTMAELIEQEKAEIENSIEAAYQVRALLTPGTPAWLGWDRIIDNLLILKDGVHLKYYESAEIAKWLDDEKTDSTLRY